MITREQIIEAFRQRFADDIDVFAFWLEGAESKRDFVHKMRV
jgi:hypothetical protein